MLAGPKKILAIMMFLQCYIHELLFLCPALLLSLQNSSVDILTHTDNSSTLTTDKAATLLVESCPHLNSTVEEAAVLPGLIHQAFGKCKRQHAPRLVGFFQASCRFLEHLCPCL